MVELNAPESRASLFKAGYSVAIRIWHWLTFFTIASTIIPVLLASTIFAIKGNVPMVQEQIQQKGGMVTSDQARAVAHEYSDKLWMLHKYFGYALCILLFSRIIIEVLCMKEQRLRVKIKKAMAFQSQNQFQKADKGHYLMVKWGYVAFYLLFLIMAVTGLGLAYEDVPFFKINHEVIVTIHSVVQYLIYFYIVAHIVGVIRADLADNKGIVSAMINGG